MTNFFMLKTKSSWYDWVYKIFNALPKDDHMKAEKAYFQMGP